MSDAGTARVVCVASCVVDDDHNQIISRDALVHMMFGALPWLRCCNEPVIVLARAVPVDEVKA